MVWRLRFIHLLGNLSRIIGANSEWCYGVIQMNLQKILAKVFVFVRFSFSLGNDTKRKWKFRFFLLCGNSWILWNLEFGKQQRTKRLITYEKNLCTSLIHICILLFLYLHNSEKAIKSFTPFEKMMLFFS